MSIIFAIFLVMGRCSDSEPSGNEASFDNSFGYAEPVECRYRSGPPDRCYCGLPPVTQTSTTELNPGRIFYGCKHHKDGGYHIFKWWDEALMEEIRHLRRAMENQAGSIRCDVSEIRADITQLKEVALVKHLQRFELKGLSLFIVIVIGFFTSYLCSRM